MTEQEPKPPRRTLVYPILLDGGYMAQVVIPFDLSAAECQRMTAFLAALVVPWRAPNAAGKRPVPRSA